MVNSGQHWPATKRVTVNLSPASLPKRGSSFDLAIAAAILAAQEVVPPHAFDDAVLLGELGLDGRVRPVRGVLPAVRGGGPGRGRGRRRAGGQRGRGGAGAGPRVTGVRTLAELVARARGERAAGRRAGRRAADGRRATRTTRRTGRTWPTSSARPTARYLLEVAAAGGHHLLLPGPPGAGKTMLAERLPGPAAAAGPRRRRSR